MTILTPYSTTPILESFDQICNIVRIFFYNGNIKHSAVISIKSAISGKYKNDPEYILYNYKFYKL